MSGSVDASGGGALVMQVRSAACCDMQSVKPGVEPAQTIAEEPAHDVKADDCDAHEGLPMSVEQLATQSVMVVVQPEVATTRAQSDAHAPVGLDASGSPPPPPPPPPPRALQAASAIERMIDEVLEERVIARSYAVRFNRQVP